MRQRHLLRRLETIRTSARRMIFGSIVPQLEMLSVLEPAASWEERREPPSLRRVR